MWFGFSNKQPALMSVINTQVSKLIRGIRQSYVVSTSEKTNGGFFIVPVLL